jgi:broad specificity phosphatase PhoE
MTKIILERHGQSLGNRDGIYLGHTDLGLSEKGKIEAEITANHLQNEKITAVYSSDLRRAMETALPHCKIHSTELKTSRELREMHVGDWEGQDVKELKKLEEFTIKRTYRDFVYPGGEGVVEAYKRMKKEIVRIAEENPETTILIVSHSAAIRAFWYYLSGYTDLNMLDSVPFMKNASYCILTYDGELHPHTFGEASHLAEVK